MRITAFLRSAACQVLPDSLTALRTCLFFEQRALHHVGEPPSESSVQYVRAVVTEIHRNVLAGELE